MNFIKIRQVASQMTTEELIGFCQRLSTIMHGAMPRLTPELIIKSVGKTKEWSEDTISGFVSLNACERACLLAAYLQVCIEHGLYDMLSELDE